ncbi:glycosyltransferase family 9 protein [Helicobacter pylori]|uniref:Glycosyltransferase family 9 protein n=1 Tax=Helicobacter pylori TaxID=210 RepID=A0AAE7DV16_HELPX|nr:glycosyltransferase family 9 protein [Helicobacter pylori]QJW29905.1 glycosyltransferase family 9 protein [Helicobacter pylori A45]QJW41192.1 glycosyltransferase family 9 protein [Helicobacter pylori]QJW42654.1 glycosyltransferase family 9 protein [Helicobacter pylori]QJW44112.1 glycosyltransferase family 9 protein [Helicobacter pylori]
MKSLLSLFLKSKLSYLYYCPYIAFVLMVATFKRLPFIRDLFLYRYPFQEQVLDNIQNQLDRLLTLTKPTPPPIRKKTLCFIRLDIIGDYILYRNFLPLFKKYFEDYETTFIGNATIKNMATHCDSQYIDKFIFLDNIYWEKYLRIGVNGSRLSKLKELLFFLPKFMRKRYEDVSNLRKESYEICINSSMFYFSTKEDAIIRHLIAENKVGVFCTHPIESLHKIRLREQTEIRKSFYTHLFYPKEVPQFLYDSNQDFFQSFFKHFKGVDIGFVELELKLPIAFEYEKFKNILKPPYGVLNLGASDDFRVYKRFDEMIYFLNPDYQLVLCGNSKEDEKLADSILKRHKNTISLVNQTGLIEYLYLLKNASFAMGNESSITHLSACLKIPHAFIVSSGLSSPRFHPYPKKVGPNIHMIYPRDFQKIISRSSNWMFKAMTMPHPPVDFVNPQDIISTIKRFAPNLLKEDAPSNTKETTYFERV